MLLVSARPGSEALVCIFLDNAPCRPTLFILLDSKYPQLLISFIYLSSIIYQSFYLWKVGEEKIYIIFDSILEKPQGCEWRPISLDRH